MSLVLLQVTLWVLETARRGGSRRLWLLPLVMLVWVNSHSLFIIGMLVIGCYMLAEITRRFRLLPAAWRAASCWNDPLGSRLLMAGAGAALATVLNPFGVRGMIFPLKLFSRVDGSREIFGTIGELTPPFSATGLLMPVVAYRIFFCAAVGVVIVSGALAMAGSRGKQRPDGPGGDGPGFDLAGLLVFSGLAGLSLPARRNMALFAMGAAPFAARCLHLLGRRTPARGSSFARLARTAGVGAGLLLLLFLGGAAWSVTTNRLYLWNLEPREFGAGTLQMNFPIKAAAFVREMELPARLFCDLTSGGYLTWDTPLGDRVYMDGRLEVYDDEFYAAYIKGLRTPEAWQEQADSAGIGTALLDHRIPAHYRLIQWLNSDPRWALVYVDEVAVVFVRAAGHEELIESARKRFASGFNEISRNLIERSPSWPWPLGPLGQWPMGRMSALANYADGLSLVGNFDRAAEFHAALLDFDLPRKFEAKVHIALARDHAARGDTDRARAQIGR